MTKTLEMEIEELKAKHARKEVELRRRHEVLAYLGDAFEGYGKPSVYFCRLYGKRGHVSFHHCRYSSIQRGKNPDAVLLRKLLERFPAVPVLRYKDGCTSFRPEVQAEKDAAKNPESGRTVDLYECGPVTVKLEPASYSQSAKFEWVTPIGEELWDMSAEFPLFGVDLGELTLRYKTYPDGEIAGVKTCEFRPKWDAQRIRWASGDHKTPNSFTLFWDRDTAKGLDYGAMVKSC
jgi:hypothetical protein